MTEDQHPLNVFVEASICKIASIPILIHFILFLYVNLKTYWMMRDDKNRARMNQWRIEEFSFMIWAALGGFLGVYVGSAKFRHKTQKTSFWSWIRCYSIIWVGMCLITLYHSSEKCEK